MLPILFHIGPIPVRAWGLALVIGFLLAVWRGAKNAHRYGGTSEAVLDSSLIGLAGGVIGGRLAFVLQNLGTYLKEPATIFAIWTGGMTSFGGLIGGIGAGVWAATRRKMRALDAADLAAVSTPIGYAVGRIGCFLNGCCYGSRCDLPWGMNFHAEGTTIDTGRVHPTQLYSAIAAVGIYFLLVKLEARRQFRGQLFLAFVILYGVYRFVVEFWRAQSIGDKLHAGLTTAQWASVLVAFLAAMLYARAARSKRLAIEPTESESETKHG